MCGLSNSQPLTLSSERRINIQHRTTTTLWHTFQFYYLGGGLGRADCICMAWIDWMNFLVQNNFNPKISWNSVYKCELGCLCKTLYMSLGSIQYCTLFLHFCYISYILIHIAVILHVHFSGTAFWLKCLATAECWFSWQKVQKLQKFFADRKVHTMSKLFGEMTVKHCTLFDWGWSFVT